jgi:hypothetical protein
VGDSSFQSLQAKLEQRFSHGLLFIASYTWGHSIDNGGGIGTGSSASSSIPQDYRDLAAERGSSDFNIDDHFTFSPVYELPFGKNRKWLQSRIPNAIAGGWQVTGILTIQTGSPFTVIYTSANNSNTLNDEDRPNQVGNPNNGPKTVKEWFNTAAFVNPGFGSFGDARRNSVIGPGLKDLDISLSRFFPVTHRVNAEFRSEAFNIFNHPNFGLPNANPNSSAFGSISTTGSTGSNNSRQIEFALRLTF